MSKRPKESLTTKEAARLLSVCEKTVRRECRAGNIPHERVGKLYRFSAEGLKQWLKNKR